MSSPGCNQVRRYLDRFLEEGVRGGADLNQISDHLSSCPECYQRVARFFRTMELPEPAYLRETIDELALALYNLAKAIIRDRPSQNPEDDTANVQITEIGGGTERDNVAAGEEMIEDAEDYVGATSIGGMDLEELRGLLHDAETSRALKTDLALGLFRRITTLTSRYAHKAWNWIGVLHYQKGELPEAEKAFMQVLGAPDGAREVRAFAHCNLAYVYKHQGDLDRAVRSARRSVVLSEEDGKDPYFGRFAELYLRLLRKAPGDEEEARGALQAILAAPGARQRLLADLELEGNRPVLEVFRHSPLYGDFSGVP